MKQLLILGAGGHGQAVFDLAKQLGHYEKIDFLDDGKDLETQILSGAIVGRLADYTQFSEQYTDAIVAIGNNEIRLQWLIKLKPYYEVPTLIHPSSFVSQYAKVLNGTVVMPQALIHTNTSVGEGAIINSGVIVEHDCMIESGAHISYGAIIGSNAVVEKCCLVDLGEVIKRNDVVKR